MTSYLNENAADILYGDFTSDTYLSFTNPIFKAFGTSSNSWIEHVNNKIIGFNHPLAAFREALKLQTQEKLYLGLALTYELGSLFEEIKSPVSSHYDIPLYSIYGFLRKDVRDSDNQLSKDPLPDQGLIDLNQLENFTLFNKKEYLKAISKIQCLIKEGETYQANLSRFFRLEGVNSGFSLFNILQSIHPGKYAFYFNLGSSRGKIGEVISHSPELFLEKQGSVITTRPIKGTRKRGFTQAEDEHLKRELKLSSKDQAELSMIVDLERNDLGRICIPGSISVNYHAKLITSSNVHHLQSEVQGEIKEGIDLIDILKATFPCGSITGAPKIATQNILADLENVQRGIYTGSLGILKPNGDFTFNVAIRTGILIKNSFFINSGGGIVFDSNPQEELLETLYKSRGLLEAWNFHKIIEKF